MLKIEALRALQRSLHGQTYPKPPVGAAELNAVAFVKNLLLAYFGLDYVERYPWETSPMSDCEPAILARAAYELYWDLLPGDESDVGVEP